VHSRRQRNAECFAEGGQKIKTIPQNKKLPAEPLRQLRTSRAVLFFFFIFIAVPPFHKIAGIHEDRQDKPNDQRKTVNKRQPEDAGFDTVDKEYAGEFDRSKTQQDQNPKQQSFLFHFSPTFL
jgi:hypothetical protein